MHKSGTVTALDLRGTRPFIRPSVFTLSSPAKMAAVKSLSKKNQLITKVLTSKLTDSQSKKQVRTVVWAHFALYGQHCRSKKVIFRREVSVEKRSPASSHSDQKPTRLPWIKLDFKAMEQCWILCKYNMEDISKFSFFHASQSGYYTFNVFSYIHVHDDQNRCDRTAWIPHGRLWSQSLMRTWPRVLRLRDEV